MFLCFLVLVISTFQLMIVALLGIVQTAISRDSRVRLIGAHLQNGASLAAIAFAQIQPMSSWTKLGNLQEE